MLFCIHRYKEWKLSQNSLLPVLSQINTIASFIKVKISDFQTRFHNELWLLAAPGEWGLTFCVHRAEADSLPAEN